VPRTAIVDTGPLVALLDASDAAHGWTVRQFRQITGPLLTCEAVVAEALYLLRMLRPAQEKILAWIDSGVLVSPFVLNDEVAQIRALWKKHADVPMSLADACLVRMSEQYDRHSVCTLDRDFTIYRKYGRKPIPLIMPPVA
jgi:predicted nucleic acid-binding protein